MKERLYLVTQYDENKGKFVDFELLDDDSLLELAKEYDEDIDEAVMLDALTSTYGYDVRIITNLDDVASLFEEYKKELESYIF